MADLELTVAARGTEQAAAGLDNVGRAGTRAASSMQQADRAILGTSTAMDRLASKLRSGEVLRNAAASAVLLGSSASGAVDKIAALGGALAAIPGPIGIIAGAVALGASAWSAWGKSAEEAARKAKEAADAIAGATAARDKALAAVAARATGTALGLGDDARRYATTPGASGLDRERLLALNPSDPGFALRGAAALAESGLDASGRERVLDALSQARRVGAKITDDSVGRAVESVRQATANSAPLSFAEEMTAASARGRYRGAGGFMGMLGVAERRETDTQADVVSDITGRDPRATRSALRAAESVFARITEASLTKAESPTVAQSQRDIADAMSGAVGTTIAWEALTAAGRDTSNSLIGLTDAAKKADEALRGIQGAQAAERAKKAGDGGGWTFRPPWRGSGE